ncbi:MAG: D-aminoacyl-tRNA deacylase [Pseudomonadota bacterium]
MIALIQRVTQARVDIGGQTVAAVDKGILALIGVEGGDTPSTADRLLDRILTYRIFPDAAGRMNLDLAGIGGGLLLVPQFTLVADTSRGTRPGFSHAASPDAARSLFGALCTAARSRHAPVGAGSFGADMQVTLTNDGPVTFNLRVPPPTS